MIPALKPGFAKRETTGERRSRDPIHLGWSVWGHTGYRDSPRHHDQERSSPKSLSNSSAACPCAPRRRSNALCWGGCHGPGCWGEHTSTIAVSSPCTHTPGQSRKGARLAHPGGLVGHGSTRSGGPIARPLSLSAATWLTGNEMCKKPHARSWTLRWRIPDRWVRTMACATPGSAFCLSCMLQTSTDLCACGRPQGRRRPSGPSRRDGAAGRHGGMMTRRLDMSAGT